MGSRLPLFRRGPTVTVATVSGDTSPLTRAAFIALVLITSDAVGLAQIEFTGNLETL